MADQRQPRRMLWLLVTCVLATVGLAAWPSVGAVGAKDTTAAARSVATYDDAAASLPGVGAALDPHVVAEIRGLSAGTTPMPRSVATEAVLNEGICVVRNGAGDVYLGQSGSITSRLEVNPIGDQRLNLMPPGYPRP